MSQRRRRLDLCTYILGDDAFGEEVTARMIACVAARRAGAIPDRRRGRHVAAAKLVPAHACGGRRDGGIFCRSSRARLRVRGTCAITANGSIADGERSVGRRAQPRGGIFLRDARLAAVDRFVVRSARARSRPRRRTSSRSTGWPRAASRRRARPCRRGRCGRTRAIPAERSRSDRGHGAGAAHRCLLSRHRAHAGGHALLRARFEPGDRHAPRGAARREDRSVHSGEIEPSPGGFRAQSLAARAARPPACRSTCCAP